MLKQGAREIQKELYGSTYDMQMRTTYSQLHPAIERAAPQSTACLAHQVKQRELCLGASASAVKLQCLYIIHSQGCPVHSNWEKALEFRERC